MEGTEIKAVGVDSLGAYVVDPGGDYYELHAKIGNNGTTWINPPVKLYKNLPSAATSGIIDLLGYATVNEPREALSLGAVRTDVNLTLNYWHITSMQNETGGSIDSWVGQRTTRVGNILNSFAGENVALVISTNLNVANMALTLRNSKDEVLPIGFGTPYRFEGVLTKASGYPIYFVPLIASSDQPYGTVDYTGKFSTNNTTLFYLADAGGVRSNYSAFSIDLAAFVPAPPVTAPEVKTLNGLSASGGVYTIQVGKEYKINFDAAEAKFVYDYKIDGVTPTLAAEPTLPGFVFDPVRGTFKMTVANASFQIKVYKLVTDGHVYMETLNLTAII
jgi:hypothetical protein